MGPIYLDACALIDTREKNTPESQALVNLIAKGAGADTPFITSDLSLVEVLTKPIQSLIDRTPEREDPVQRGHHDWYVTNLIPDGLLFNTRPLHRDIMVKAAILRARTPSLRTPDALHVATALFFGCTHFVTGDTRLITAIVRDEDWLRAPERLDFVPTTVAALDSLRTEYFS